MEIIHSSRIYDRTDSDFLTNMHNFLKANGSWYSTDDTNKILYVTDKIYIQLITDSSAFAVDLKDNSTGAAWSSPYSAYYANAQYFNATIFKVNNDCFGIAFNSGSDGVTYSTVCPIIIDSYTVDGNTNKMVVARRINDRTHIADGKTNNVSLYSTYSTDSVYPSLSESYPTGQIAPFVSPYGGQKADNLHTILLTNQTNAIVTLNGTEKWLFTNTFALPCGDEVTETYYEEE